MRGEIHPGVMVGGVLIAIAVAWWFARDPLGPSTADFAEAGEVRARDTSGAGSGAPAAPAAQKPLYRWQDDEGVVHFTDVAPANRAYTEVSIDPETNVVPSA